MRSLLDVRARIERSASEWPNEGDLRLSARSALAGIERYIEDAIVRTEAADHAALHLWFRHYLADIRRGEPAGLGSYEAVRGYETTAVRAVEAAADTSRTSLRVLDIESPRRPADWNWGARGEYTEPGGRR